MNRNGLKHAARSLALFAILGSVAHVAAQGMQPMQSMEGKSLYERMGGIQKISLFVDTAVRNSIKDDVLMGNENFKKVNQAFPVPAIDFLLTDYFSSKTGGPQVYSGPDLAGIEAWFMLTPEQVERQHMIIADAMKQAGCDQMAIDDFGKWWMDAHMHATPVEPSPETISDKESLYGRLGGIVPISVVVDDFVNSLAADKTIMSNPHVIKALSDGHISVPGLKYLVTEQLASAAGGPYKYSGRTMADAHKGLMISEDEWSAGGKILVATLNKYHVPEKEQGEIVAVISSTKGDIVGK